MLLKVLALIILGLVLGWWLTFNWIYRNWYMCHYCEKSFDSKVEGFEPLETMEGSWPACCKACWDKEVAEKYGYVGEKE